MKDKLLEIAKASYEENAARLAALRVYGHPLNAVVEAHYPNLMGKCFIGGLNWRVSLEMVAIAFGSFYRASKDVPDNLPVAALLEMLLNHLRDTCDQYNQPLRVVEPSYDDSPSENTWALGKKILVARMAQTIEVSNAGKR